MIELFELLLAVIPFLWAIAYCIAIYTKNENWIKRLEIERKIWRWVAKFFRRSVVVVLLSVALITSGCIGASNGGSSYRLRWTTDQGEIIDFTGDRSTDETNLNSAVTIKKDGTIAMTHNETSKQGTADPLLTGVGELLKSLATLTEKITPLLEKAAASGL